LPPLAVPLPSISCCYNFYIYCSFKGRLSK
jgi:hypothetical protein